MWEHLSNTSGFLNWLAIKPRLCYFKQHSNYAWTDTTHASFLSRIGFENHWEKFIRSLNAVVPSSCRQPSQTLGSSFFCFLTLHTHNTLLRSWPPLPLPYFFPLPLVKKITNDNSPCLSHIRWVFFRTQPMVNQDKCLQVTSAKSAKAAFHCHVQTHRLVDYTGHPQSPHRVCSFNVIAVQSSFLEQISKYGSLVPLYQQLARCPLVSQIRPGVGSCGTEPRPLFTNCLRQSEIIATETIWPAKPNGVEQSDRLTLYWHICQPCLASDLIVQAFQGPGSWHRTESPLP